MFEGNLWYAIKDGNPSALAMYKRHYSRYVYQDGRKPNRFVGPGERMVLMTSDQSALFVWRKFKSMNNQEGINCAVFRNEGKHLSSRLILDAEYFAQERWRGQRMYTYVNVNKIQSSNAGYCFKVAGWQQCGITKTRKLLILEKLPVAVNNEVRT